jgi:hypothetical protein
MDIVEFGMTDAKQAEMDRGLVVRFSMGTRLDSAKTAEAGREIYREVEYVTILIPGDRLVSPVHRPVQASDKSRFPAQYAAFKNAQSQNTQAITGTPLSAWPVISPSQRKELEYLNIVTVEQLAAVSDGSAQNLAGLHGLKQLAQKFIEASKSAAPLVALQKELETRDNAIAALTARLDAMSAPAKSGSKAQEKSAA